LAGLDRGLEADIGVGILAKLDIALQRVQRDERVFPPGRVCQLEGIAAPAELVQVGAKRAQEMAPLLRALELRDQWGGSCSSNTLLSAGLWTMVRLSFHKPLLVSSERVRKPWSKRYGSVGSSGSNVSL
jgi:uncharacterized MAPEG superfamily protein